MQAKVANRQQRIIELEKQLAIAKAKAEQLEVRTATMRREAQTASTMALELRRKIDKGERGLVAVKSASGDKWEAIYQGLQVVWDDLHVHPEEMATDKERDLEN